MREWLAGWFERWLLASWHCSHPLCPKREENAVHILKSTVKQQSLPANNFTTFTGRTVYFFETYFEISRVVFTPKYQVQIILLFVYTTIHKRFVIFTCRYFKLPVNWNTTALSQSNYRNFSCSSIRALKLQSRGSEFNPHPSSSSRSRSQIGSLSNDNGSPGPSRLSMSRKSAREREREGPSLTPGVAWLGPRWGWGGTELRRRRRQWQRQKSNKFRLAKQQLCT